MAPRGWRRVRPLLLIVAFAIAALGGQGVASATLTADSATLNGATSVSTPPGGVMSAKLDVSISGTGAQWSGTQYGFNEPNPTTCVDTDRRETSGSETFNVTAPASPGNYAAQFRARANSDCSGEQSNVLTLPKVEDPPKPPDAVRVTTPAPNPNLAPRCGINVMLVLDESGSVKPYVNDVRNAAKAFIGALSGTGSKVSIIEFSTSANRPVGYTTVTSDTIASTFNPYIDKQYNPDGWTNWEDAFQLTHQANVQGPVADMVVFITDGDPTARNNPPNQPITGLTEGDSVALGKAATEADLVKGDGSHVFAVGVGSAVTKPTSATRLTAVSGTDQVPPADLEKGDYTLVQNFSDLAAALAQLATGLCQSSVTVTKLVDNLDGKGYQAKSGWNFTTSVSMSAGTFEWITPLPKTPATPRSAATGADGTASFQWKPSSATATSTVSIAEDLSVPPQQGYEFVDANCVKSGTGNKKVTGKVRTGSTTVGSITLAPRQYATCTVRNRKISGKLEVRKRLLPASDGGRFDLLIDGTRRAQAVGDGGTTGEVTLPVGQHTVAEAATSAQTALSDYTITAECRDGNGSGSVVASGTGPGPLNVNVAQGSDVVCTFTNERKATIRILKDVTPDDPTASFGFSGSLGSFSLGDNGSSTFQVRPGTYTVTESTIPVTSQLTAIDCVPTAGTSVQIPSVSITVPAGGSVACTFRNGPAPPALFQLDVVKLVDEVDGRGFQPEDGWEFTTAVTATPGPYSWTVPAPPPTTGPRSQTTGNDGMALFRWQSPNPTTSSAVTVTEASKQGYEPVDSSCTSNVGPGQRQTTTTQIFNGTLAPNESVVCVVRNKRRSGTLEVRKVLRPAKDSGRFDLLIDGDVRADAVGNGGTTGPVDVPEGNHTVRETISSNKVSLGDYVTDVRCRDDNGQGDVVASGDDAGPLRVNVPDDAQIVCTFTNERRGSIRIIKEAVPQGPQNFSFTGSFGPFSLDDDPSDTTLPNQQTFTGLAPDSYNVSETVPKGWSLSGIACSDGTKSSTPKVSIDLPPGGAVSCTFKNGQDPEPPPTPPTPPPPSPPVTPPVAPPTTGGGVAPAPPKPPVLPARTQLRVDKRAPAVAREGEIIEASLTVTNVGGVTARDVRLYDIPPAAVKLTLQRESSRRARVVRGNSVWRLGNLAPGAKRTVTLQVRIDTAAPGDKRNVAAATATNADQALDATDTRILGAPPAISPAVTG